MKEPDRERVRHLKVRLEVTSEFYHSAKVEFERVYREYHDAFRELMDYEESRCHHVIHPGRGHELTPPGPIYCQLDRGHTGACRDPATSLSVTVLD